MNATSSPENRNSFSMLAATIVLSSMLMIFYASCVPGKTRELSSDTTAADSAGLATVVVTQPNAEAEAKADNSTQWSIDTLTMILLRDSIIAPGDPVELITPYAIQLDKLNAAHVIQAVGIVSMAPAQDGTWKECIFIAFFETVADAPKLIAYMNYGERSDSDSFGSVELMPGRFAITLTYDTHTEGSTEDGYTKEDVSEVVYFALKGDEVVSIFSYVQRKSWSYQGPEGAEGNTLEVNKPQFGTLQAGQLCLITLVDSGGEATARYSFNGNSYVEKR